MSLSRDEVIDTDVSDHRTALSDLYRAEFRSLVRLACLLLDRVEAAEEVVQDAFIKLDQNWDRVDSPSSRPAYLRSIVMNLARSRMRRRLVARKHQPRPEPDAPSAEHYSVIREDQREVLDAVRALPTRQREVMVLRYWQDLSEREIAETLGISPGAVKSHASRALATLTKQLEAHS